MLIDVSFLPPSLLYIETSAGDDLKLQVLGR